MPTNTRGNAQYDNLLFHSQATTEFTGRGGVYDFMRVVNLTLDQALKVSDHLPVWAEFSVYEGGAPGRVSDGLSSRAVFQHAAGVVVAEGACALRLRHA